MVSLNVGTFGRHSIPNPKDKLDLVTKIIEYKIKFSSPGLVRGKQSLAMLTSPPLVLDKVR